MPLKTTNTFPPGGYPYTQKETGFSVSRMMPFSSVVGELSRHRAANGLPRASKQECAQDIDEYTCQRLGNDPRYCISSVKKNPLTGTKFLSASAQHVKNLVRLAVKARDNFGTGTQILADWLGDGLQSVSSELSQSRADICTGRTSGDRCPYNQPSPSVELITKPIASAIEAQIQKKVEIGLKVEGEENLHTCSLCWCRLSLKVHVPFETIAQRTPNAMMNKFPNYCWIKKEQQQTPAKQ